MSLNQNCLKMLIWKMEVPVETDAGEVHADLGSDEVLQPKQDEDIQDPEDFWRYERCY